MGVSHGMNIDEIEALGRNLQGTQAARLRDLAAEVDRLVGDTVSSWRGGDAELFRSWWPAKRPAMLAMANDLHGFGQSALNNASEQRGASDASSVSGGAGAFAAGATLGGMFQPSDQSPLFGVLDGLGSLGDLDTILKLGEATTVAQIREALKTGLADAALDIGTIAVAWDEYGIGDARTWEAIVGSVGTAIGHYVPGGSIVWDYSMDFGSFIGDSFIGEAMEDSIFAQVAENYDLNDPADVARMNEAMANPLTLIGATGEAFVEGAADTGEAIVSGARSLWNKVF